LGIGATLNRLTRTKIGDFKLEDAVDLKNLSFKDIKDHLCPLSKALSNLLTIYVKDTTIRKLISGQEIDCLEQKCPSRVFTRIWFDKLLKATPVKILDEEERAMLIGFYSFGRLKPVRLVYADLPKTE
jgi:tRNA U55 pseudouridine synthase TruB